MGAASSSDSLRDSCRLQDPADPADLRRGTPILAAAFVDGAAFLHAYHAQAGKAGELALVTRAAPESATPVVLEISWPLLPNRVYVRARVYRRRLGLMAKLHADEVPACEFLVRAARGEPMLVHPRNDRRYCVRLPVWWHRFGETQRNTGIAEDLSSAGVLVATDAVSPRIGERVALRLLAAAAAQDLVMTGVVRHLRERSRDNAFGVQFAYRSTGEQRSLRQLMRVFAGRGVVIIE